jgi:urease beta subunit
MQFEREKAFGMRLNIPAGTAVRFEPGEEKEIELVNFGGNQKIFGFNNLVDSASTGENKKDALAKAKSKKFKGVD